MGEVVGQGKENGIIIDIHSHFIPRILPDFNARYGYSGFVSLDTTNQESKCGILKKGNKEISEVPSSLWDLGERIRFMDEHGIQTQVLSPLPSLFSYWAKADDTADLCRIVNNSMAKEISRLKPKENNTIPPRFVGLGIVPMQAPELAVVELERCIKELGFRGVLIGTHVNEWNLDTPELVPFWEKCEELECGVMIHPWDMHVSRKDRKLWLDRLIGMPHESNRAITTIILGGVLDQFPKLKLCFSDGGGSFPYVHGRIEQGYKLNPEKCAVKCDVPPEKFLGKFYCDSLVGDISALDLLVKVVSKEKILFGSNYPFIPGSFPSSSIAKVVQTECVNDSSLQNGIDLVNKSSLDVDAKQQVLGLNALEFLGMLEK